MSDATGGWTATLSRPAAVGGTLLVAASVAVSLVARGPLGARTRIRWSVGHHVGPEYAPTTAVLVAFPVGVAALFAGLTWLGRRLDRTDEFEMVRPYYAAAVLGTLGLLVVVQAALVVANL